MQSGYNTKQKSEILEYLMSCPGHATAAQITHDLSSKVSLATVYRRLERLVGEGLVRKYVTDGCSCYQYSGQGCNGHFHLKCTKCGTLYHTDCSFLSDLAQHIYSHHTFKVDQQRTVLYGICSKCIEISEE